MSVGVGGGYSPAHSSSMLFLTKNNVLIVTVFFYFVWFTEAFFTLSKLGTEGNLAVGGEGCLQQIVSLS